MRSVPSPVNVSFVIYQDPLAYLLGLEGIALLDAFAGDYDREFTDARLAEIRQLLDDQKLRDRGVLAERVSTVIAYEQQAAGYDAEAGGGLFTADEPLVAQYLSGREPGVALDAACGTGRFAEFLAGRGHRVIGVDSSPDMLAHARRRVPEGEFHVAELGLQVRQCEGRPRPRHAHHCPYPRHRSATGRTGPGR